MFKKIFIIEDDPNFLFSLQIKLKLEGFEISIHNGTDNLEHIINKIRIFKPDILILDLILPNVDGFKIIENIKSDEHIILKPIIFVLTNMLDEDTRLKCERLGADYFFGKNDLIIDEFVKKIKKIINNLAKFKNEKN